MGSEKAEKKCGRRQWTSKENGDMTCISGLVKGGSNYFAKQKVLQDCPITYQDTICCISKDAGSCMHANLYSQSPEGTFRVLRILPFESLLVRVAFFFSNKEPCLSAKRGVVKYGKI